jgi:predicted Zn-dependent protease
MHRSSLVAACGITLMICSTAAAQSEQITPFTSVPQKLSLHEEESRIWDDAADADKGLRRRGALYGDAKVDGYLQSLLDQLYPELKGAARVRTINDPDLNAFAMPNGSLYINLGLLARLENEAQLAAVLAHEGAHFAYRHGYQQRQSAKTASAFALGIGMIGGVAGALGQLAAVSSIYGFSQEHENEADRIGFERMVKLGYDTQQGIRVFELLRDEAKLMDRKASFMFSSHPKLEDRVDSFKRLRESSPASSGATRTEEERFLASTQEVRQAWINQAFDFSRYKSLIHVLEQPQANKRFPIHYAYYIGEAYRLRNEKEDYIKALQSYKQALDRAPGFAKTYKALGMLHMNDNQKTEARAMFEKYLAIQPDGEEAGYVKSYIQQIQ